MPLSHIGLAAGSGSTYKEMRDFYVSILQPLGYSIFMEQEGVFLGMGPKHGAPDFWLHASGEMERFGGDVEKRGPKTHVAFQAKSPKVVQEWYKAAIKAGGVCNGKPGLRPEYEKRYYGAFVIDPLGNNIEAMSWNPWWLTAMKSMPYVFTGLIGAAVAVTAGKYYG